MKPNLSLCHHLNIFFQILKVTKQTNIQTCNQNANNVNSNYDLFSFVYLFDLLCNVGSKWKEVGTKVIGHSVTTDQSKVYYYTEWFV